ncbi:MAG: GGDEF domain-containing protein [Oscillospiraceae bacterium]|nr:GGDEF domain-containing protein [Oscillospiraceae bacterium]
MDTNRGDEMNLQAILVSNGFGIGLMVMLLVSSRNIMWNHTLSEKIFRLLIWATIAFCSFEALSFCIDGLHFPYVRVVSIVVTIALISTITASAFLWTLYVDYKLFDDIGRLKKRAPLLALPAVAVICLSVMSAFAPVLFFVSPDNVYSRSALSFLPFASSFFYLLYAEIEIYLNRKNAKSYLVMPSIIFLIPIFIGILLQFMFYGLSLVCASLAISIVSLYINIQGESSHIDSLSGLYTRAYLDYRIQRMSIKCPEGSILVGILFDVDRFKDINDNFGHLAGDSAIRNIGRLLRVTAESGDFAARYGGDEFVIIKAVKEEYELLPFFSHLEDGLAELNRSCSHPYHLSLSYGYSVYDSANDTPDLLFRRMDQSMYEQKRSKSREFAERRKPASDR